jgi:hypothetical protein
VIDVALLGIIRRSSSGLDKYSVQLSGWLKAEASKPRKQRRNLWQPHLDLKELGYMGSYDRVTMPGAKCKSTLAKRFQDVGTNV